MRLCFRVIAGFFSQYLQKEGALRCFLQFGNDETEGVLASLLEQPVQECQQQLFA